MMLLHILLAASACSGIIIFIAPSAQSQSNSYDNTSGPIIHEESVGETLPSEHRLLQSLLDTGYDKRQRPVRVANQTLNVTINFNVFNLVDLDEKSNVLTTSTWLSLIWHDYRLQWEPDDHEGLQFFTLDIKDIWVPKIFLQNTASEGPMDPSANGISRVIVIYDGTLLLDSPGIINSLCQIDIINFPFDKQQCVFSFTTQNVPDDLVHLQAGKGVVSSAEAATWRLQQTMKVDSYVISIEAVPHMQINYPYVKFYLDMERLPGYYLYTVGLPSTTLTVLAFFSFWLPADCGEKLSFVVSLMLGMTVFQFVIADILPETSRNKQPLMSTFLLINLVMVGMTLFLTLITITLYSSRRRFQNRRVRHFLVNTLPSFLCINTTNGVGDDVKVIKNDKPQLNNDEKSQENNKSVSDQMENGTNGTKKLRRTSSVYVSKISDMMILAEVLDRMFFFISLVAYFASNWIMINSYDY